MLAQNIENKQLEANTAAVMGIKSKADRFVSALYSPSKMEKAIRMAKSSNEPDSAMISLFSDPDGKNFTVLKGGDLLGVETLSLDKIASMNYENSDGAQLKPMSSTMMGKVLLGVQEAKMKHPEINSLDVSNVLVDDLTVDISSKSELLSAIERMRDSYQEPLPDRPKMKLAPN